ncbi:hypothetical protein FIBSPDRAFT_994338 [Athelia psychrophila]|uniref:Carbamoyl phosphate synthase ATP-binding domain-containing protein n=1 Tax=Athelia psychrophila TaxID=1759441 RepID=A0A166RXE9_9AGAM|nr:hypothetical protein FIBSPDRAFT_994338 [Fibularhizoctonia sp. CBS 109695]
MKARRGSDRGRRHRRHLGDMVHLRKRECSVQWRFQKVAEVGIRFFPRPFTCLWRVARSLRYQGMDTFEYIVNSHTGRWVFLGINPCIQVEHMVTEEITNLDIVRMQLHLSNSATLTSLHLNPTTIGPPQCCAIQLRLAAEDPAQDFRLSPGANPPQFHRVARRARSARRYMALRRGCARVQCGNSL